MTDPADGTAQDRPWGQTAALSGADYSAVELASSDDRVFMLDQRLLPVEQRYHTLGSCAEVARGIADMVVRGAPAIGISAAYGMALGAYEGRELSEEAYRAHMARCAKELLATRPTAVNLSWAVQRCLAVVEQHAASAGEERHQALCALGREIHRQDVDSCRAMGRFGAEKLAGAKQVMTHCNAGALATGGYGTALGVIRAAAEDDSGLQVWACETRPYLQGARLTAWELFEDGVDVTLVSDSMAGSLMQRGLVDAIVVGADRIARNGDVANKIGTYALACLARHHGLPFYVAAPWSTVDLETATGADIPIEERAPVELTHLGERQLAPSGVKVHNPAFDVTPAALVTAIFTERGTFAPGEIANAADA